MKRSLRPYQKKAKAAMSAALASGKKNTVLSLCPSGGKTFTAIDWLDENFLSKGKRVLWIVHRDELSQGAAQTFIDQVEFVKVSMWAGATKDSSGTVVILSNQSFQSWVNLIAKHAAENSFDIIVIDECHHATKESTYDRIVSVTQHEFLLGLSGTPDPVKGKEGLFSHVCFNYSFTQAHVEGYCARPIYRRCKTKQSHLFQIKMGEFTNASLKALNNAPRNEYVAEKFWDHRTEDGCKCKGSKCPKSWWPGMFYASDVEHAWAIRNALVAEGAKRGMHARFEVVTGETDLERRREVIASYRDGRVDGIVNCGVFTEGTDLPSIRSIQMCRPTASERLWTQITLRGGRSFPEFVVTGDDDPSKGLHPDNHFYLVDYVDSAHLAENMSRQMAMKFLDSKQVRNEIACNDDSELKKKIVKEAGMEAAIKEMVDGLFGVQQGTITDPKSKKRFVQYEESGLEMEEFVLAGVASILIYSLYNDPEQKRTLSAAEDTAVLLGREYITRLITRESKPDERKAAIKRTYDLFASEVMQFKTWSGIMDAFISYSIYHNAVKADGRRTWMYLSGLSAPPEEEVIKAIDEIEKEYDDANKKFDAAALWAMALVEAEKRWPSPMWRAIEAKCSNFTWREKIFGLDCSAGSTVKQVWWMEAAVQVLIQEITGYEDAVVVARVNPITKRKCPQCQELLELRMSSSGGRFLGCRGFRSKKCNYTEKWMSKRDAMNEMRLMLGQRVMPITRR